MDPLDRDEWSEWEIVIVGGGVAGLSAANRLADIGHHSLVIEVGDYPTHRLCGEFISPEAMPILDEWGLSPASEIDAIALHSGTKQHTYSLKHAAGAISRYELDHALVERVRSRGCCVRTRTQVTEMRPGDPHRLRLSTGERILAKQLIVGTGRLANTGPVETPYFGFKAHLDGVDAGDALEFFPLKGGYLGIAPIGKGRVNVACLIAAKEQPNIDEILNTGAVKDRLAGRHLLFPDWLTAQVPRFGARPVPNWPNAYFIGDAAASIAPASGDGLAMAITSGWLAAEYASAGDAKGFRWAWRKEYASRLRWANRWQTVAMMPWATQLAMRASTFYPPLSDWIFHKTRN